jgi:hypothetical protein
LSTEGRRTDPCDQDHEKRKFRGETFHVWHSKDVSAERCVGVAKSRKITKGPGHAIYIVLRGF